MSRVIGLLGLIFLLSGCGFFYENRLDRDLFTLHSDHPPEFLERTARDVERIYASYIELFGLTPEQLGQTEIYLEGESGPHPVVDHRYSPRLLGYYLPFFNVINLDTIPAWTRDSEVLRQILLHEISHHFFITRHPEVSGECWLNEGLAGNLEVSLFDETHFETPLLNPQLLVIARLAVLADPDSVDLRTFIFSDWGEFHRENLKSRHYALAWSVVYFILEHVMTDRLPLGDRIRLLHQLDREELARLEPEWKAFLVHFDLTSALIRHSQLMEAGPLDPSLRLTALWAIDQLGSLRQLDRNRVLQALLAGFEHDEPEVRRKCYLAFIDTARRLENEEFLDTPRLEAIRRGRDTLRELVSRPETPRRIRREILEACERDLLEQPGWLPVYIEALADSEGEIRVVAARGLGMTRTKPTMINPDFWLLEPAVHREREVQEWRDWWTRNFIGPASRPALVSEGIEGQPEPASAEETSPSPTGQPRPAIFQPSPRPETLPRKLPHTPR